jgi:hypothetical protein
VLEYLAVVTRQECWWERLHCICEDHTWLPKLEQRSSDQEIANLSSLKQAILQHVFRTFLLCPVPHSEPTVKLVGLDSNSDELVCVAGGLLTEMEKSESLNHRSGMILLEIDGRALVFLKLRPFSELRGKHSGED